MTKDIDNRIAVSHKGQVIVYQTRNFASWLAALRDRRAKVRIVDRVNRLVHGNAGDTKSVGDGVQELRLAFGPGYRVYYTWHETALIILLTGGDKDSQKRDIVLAKQLAKESVDGLRGFEV